MDSVISVLLEWIESSRDKSRKEILDHVCDFLRSRVDAYNWVGIYVVDGDYLKLFSYSGEETEHKRIKIGDGLCSLAILKNRTVNEPDVKSNTDYLACFPSTESELVVPISHNGKAVGEIDIDSDTRSAFTMSDEKSMDILAVHISSLVAAVAA